MAEREIIEGKFRVVGTAHADPAPATSAPPIWIILLVIGFAWRILAGH